MQIIDIRGKKRLIWTSDNPDVIALALKKGAEVAIHWTAYEEYLKYFPAKDVVVIENEDEQIQSIIPFAELKDNLPDEMSVIDPGPPFCEIMW